MGHSEFQLINNENKSMISDVFVYVWVIFINMEEICGLLSKSHPKFAYIHLCVWKHKITDPVYKTLITNCINQNNAFVCKIQV